MQHCKVKFINGILADGSHGIFYGENRVFFASDFLKRSEPHA